MVRALTAIDEAGLIDRDLKPGNVMMTPTGPRVIDFGIAQTIPGSGGVTAAGIVVGSPGWIAPERLNRSFATPAADVFGWGTLIAYAGTGRNPFGDGDSDEVARRTVHEEADLDGLPESLLPLVTAALAKDPADRPSASELLARLDPEDPLASPEPRARPSRGNVLAVSAARWRGVNVLAAGSTAVALAATFVAIMEFGSGPAVNRGPAAEPRPPSVIYVPQPGDSTGSHTSYGSSPVARTEDVPARSAPGARAHDSWRHRGGRGGHDATDQVVRAATSAAAVKDIDDLLRHPRPATPRRAVASAPPDGQERARGVGEEVVALVVDDDEGGEVLDLDLPDRLHAELGVLEHLDLA